MADYNINLELIDDKVKFIGTSQANANQPLRLDFAPPLGTGDGFAGLELLVFSFASCVSTTVLMLLRRTGVQITGFRTRAEGFRKERPMSLEKIVFSMEIESPDATAETVELALVRARAIAPVWQALNENIVVETGFTIAAK